MKINIEELSKIKHIYHVYEDPQKIIHCNKYPVIYINQYIVYYKVPGDISLSTTSFDCIYDICNNDWLDNCNHNRISSLFWEVDLDLSTCNKIRSESYKIKDAIDDVNRIKKQYAKIKDALFKAEYNVMKLTEDQGDFTFKSGDVWHNKTEDEYWFIVNHSISDNFLLGRTCYLANEYTGGVDDTSILIGNFVIKYDYIFNQYYKDDQLLKLGSDKYPEGTWEKICHISDEHLLKYHIKDNERDESLASDC